MATFLRDEKVLAADIIAVQEPWRNELQHTSHQPATASFQWLYPTKDATQEENQESDPPPPGVCLFVSKKLDPSTWSCQLISQDYQLLKLRKTYRDRDWTDLFILNICNRPGSETLERLRCELSK